MSQIPEKENVSSTEEITSIKSANNDSPEYEDSVAEDVSVKDEYDQYETIFGDPTEHTDRNKASSGNKKRIISLIVAFLSVAVLVGGTLAVIKFIPKKETGVPDSSTPFEEITVLENETDKLTNVTVTNSNGEFKFYSETTAAESTSSDSTAKTQTTWYLEGVGKDLVNTTKINSIVSSAAIISASRSIDSKTAAECGLETPKYKIDVVSQEYGNYSVLVGLDSPDGTGVYLKLSTSDKIYIVESTAVSDFEFAKLDLATTANIAGLTVPSGVTGYSDENGGLTSFDKVVVSGDQFPKAVEIVPASADDPLATYAAFNVIKPTEHIAENLDGVLSVFSSGITVSGAYSFDVSAESLKAVGLDSPDIVITMTIGSASRTFKISHVDDQYLAVIADDSKLIHKVSVSNITFAGFKAENFYASWVFLRSINDISNITFTESGTSYSFDIKYDDSEDAEETYVITHNGEKLVAQNFQDFYQIFVSLSCNDFSIDNNLMESPATIVTITYTANGSTESLEFTKCSETKYQYSVNGVPMGKITAASYNKLIKNLKLVSQGKEVVN